MSIADFVIHGNLQLHSHQLFNSWLVDNCQYVFRKAASNCDIKYSKKKTSWLAFIYGKIPRFHYLATSRGFCLLRGLPLRAVNVLFSLRSCYLQQLKPDDESSVLQLTPRDTKELRVMKNGCALLQSSHPSVPQHTFCSPYPLICPSPPCPRSHTTKRSVAGCGPLLPSVGSHLWNPAPTQTTCPGSFSARAKLPPLYGHYPFNVSLSGVSFLLLTPIQVQSIITPRGTG